MCEDVAGALMTLLQAPRAAHAIYNAPCESCGVNDLKRSVGIVEFKHSCRHLATVYAKGNPRLLDFSRFKTSSHFHDVYL